MASKIVLIATQSGSKKTVLRKALRIEENDPRTLGDVFCEAINKANPHVQFKQKSITKIETGGRMDIIDLLNEG